MQRRGCLTALAAMALAALVRPVRVRAQVGPGQKATLQDILEKRLRVRFPSERKFIEKLLPHVGPGKTFSEPEVLALMRKALAQNAKFPFPYFRLMVQILASRRGLAL